jgi:hemoglobin
MDGSEPTLYQLLGGEPAVRRIVETFYDAMERDEPALARLHRVDEQGRVAPEHRERFALFFIGWLGGPQIYLERHGHPRLRGRHAKVTVDVPMRDAWLRAMSTALDAEGVAGPLREYLDQQLAEVADFLRNRPG